MKNHPGHFWICAWLFVIVFALIGISEAIEKQTATIESFRMAFTQGTK